MKIDLNIERTIAEVQREFSQQFPALSLRFFTKKHEAYKGSPAKFMINDPSQKLIQIEKNPHSGNLYIEDDMPTWQVERLFEEAFGLHVQVFRKSGNTWLETSVTDDLTLDAQNTKGLQSLRHHFDHVDPMDYREQD
ncbi:MAG: hypothetical protein KGS48_00250 [Bacteroidetes bacterium]|nr:hypothetical protein [Bacteroidota bacterium]